MKLRWIRYGLEELKFLKSFDDLKIFYKHKLPFFISRLSGNPIRETKEPPSLQLEPTNYCNLNCISCSRDRVKRKKGYMDYKLFQKIIDDASVNNIKRIHLYFHGEPLLHPEIVKMIRYIKSKDIGITLATNGMLFNKEKIDAILNSGVNSADYFIFSMLGYSKAVHERIMKGVNHERVVQNLFDFLELRKKLNINGPIIETVFYKMPENEDEEELFNDKWQGIVDHVHPVEKVSEQFSKFRLNNNSIAVRGKTCKNLWERMSIFWNGDVTRCIADLDGEYVFGSLREQSIREIWNSSELLFVKKLHKEGKFQQLQICSRCDW